MKSKPRTFYIFGATLLILGLYGLFVGFGNALSGNICGIKDIPGLLQVGPVEFIDKGLCGDPEIVPGMGRAINYVASIFLDLCMWLIPFSIFLIIFGFSKNKKSQHRI